MSRPVLLTVDDDPQVSRAVARDLRRRFGEDCRIVRASSGAEALEALRELKLRGEPVAVLLADYRMPQMNGIEFLEQAMDLFPRARRALLTAYADTDAAIAAINLVDVDAYLLKPWDPPEEKLYPVVDTMLDAWQASPAAAVEDVKLVGHRWSPASFRARDLLARNAVPYRWYSVEEPEGQRLLEAAGRPRTTSRSSSPPSGQVLRAPADAELAAVVGLTVDAARASSTTSSWSAAAPPGWAPRSTAPPRGCAPCSSSARPPAGRPGRAAGSRTTSASPTASPAASSPTGPAGRPASSAPRCCSPATSSALEAHGPEAGAALRRRQRRSPRTPSSSPPASPTAASGVDGADDLTGRGVYYGSALTEAASCAGRDVYIVGGANSAGQAAVFFARHAAVGDHAGPRRPRWRRRCRTT